MDKFSITNSFGHEKMGRSPEAGSCLHSKCHRQSALRKHHSQYTYCVTEHMLLANSLAVKRHVFQTDSHIIVEPIRDITGTVKRYFSTNIRRAAGDLNKKSYICHYGCNGSALIRETSMNRARRLHPSYFSKKFIRPSHRFIISPITQNHVPKRMPICLDPRRIGATRHFSISRSRRNGMACNPSTGAATKSRSPMF